MLLGESLTTPKRSHHLKTSYHISQQKFLKMISQTQAVNHQEQAYFMRLFTLFCGLGKHLEWVQCHRVQVGTKGWPFWAFRIPNSLRIGHLRRLWSLPMIGSLQCSKLPWPGHDFQSWKLCSALSISKESFSLYLYIVTLGVLNTNDWVLQEEPHGLYICWCVFSFNRLLKMCGYHFNSFPAVWIFKG